MRFRSINNVIDKREYIKYWLLVYYTIRKLIRIVVRLI